MPVLHHSRKQTVAIREDVGADGDVLTDTPFDRKPPGIDFRPDSFDDDSTTTALVTRPGNPNRSIVGANPRLDAIH
jgi:hypothetical protein